MGPSEVSTQFAEMRLDILSIYVKNIKWRTLTKSTKIYVDSNLEWGRADID